MKRNIWGSDNVCAKSHRNPSNTFCRYFSLDQSIGASKRCGASLAKNNFCLKVLDRLQETKTRANQDQATSISYYSNWSNQASQLNVASFELKLLSAN